MSRIKQLLLIGLMIFLMPGLSAVAQGDDRPQATAICDQYYWSQGSVSELSFNVIDGELQALDSTNESLIVYSPPEAPVQTAQLHSFGRLLNNTDSIASAVLLDDYLIIFAKKHHPDGRHDTGMLIRYDLTTYEVQTLDLSPGEIFLSCTQQFYSADLVTPDDDIVICTNSVLASEYNTLSMFDMNLSRTILGSAENDVHTPGYDYPWQLLVLGDDGEFYMAGYKIKDGFQILPGDDDITGWMGFAPAVDVAGNGYIVSNKAIEQPSGRTFVTEITKYTSDGDILWVYELERIPLQDPPLPLTYFDALEEDRLLIGYQEVNEQWHEYVFEECLISVE